MQSPKKLTFRHHFCFADEQTETGELTYLPKII